MIDTIIIRLHGTRKYKKFVKGKKKPVVVEEPHYQLYKDLNKFQADLHIYHSKKQNITNRVVVDRKDLDFELPPDVDDDDVLYIDKDQPNKIKAFNPKKLKKGMPFDEKTIDIFTGELSKTLITLRPDTWIWKNKNYRNGKPSEPIARGDVWLPTKHYHIAFSLNPNKHYIELNFSIPKFLYGTNVFQFLEHHDTPTYHATDSRTYERQSKRLFSRFMGFMDYFFREVFPEYSIDKKLVQLFRIDFCFNQVFDSEKDARDYQSYLLGVQKKGSRRDARVQFFSAGGSDLFLSGSRQSHNIYHKGDEFVKDDLPELKKINEAYKKKFGKVLYTDLAAIEDLAMRTVRYEWRVRNPKLSYLHKRHTFRKDCFDHQKRVKLFDNLHNTKFKYESFKPEQWEYRKRRGLTPSKLSDVKIKPNEREFYERFRNMMGWVCELNLSNKKNPWHVSTPTVKTGYNLISGNYNPYGYMNIKDLKKNDPRTTVTSSLFRSCMKEFLEFINNYQLSKKPNNFMIMELISKHNEGIREYNKTHTKKKREITASKFAGLFSLLDKGYTFDTACGQLMFNRKKKYRYKKELESIGMDVNSILPHRIEKNVGFWRYQDFFEEYYNTFFKQYV